MLPELAAAPQHPRAAAASRSPASPARSSRRRRSCTRCSSIACRASASRCPASLLADPSTPRPTLTPASRICLTGAIPEPSRQFEQGQCATPVPVRAKRSISPASSFTQWACQTCSPVQPRSSAYCPGRQPNCAERIGDVLVVLGEVGVQHHPLVARQRRGVAHQPGRDREGRAGRQPDPHHRPGRRIVEGVHHPHHVGEDRRLGLDHAVRRQPARALADAHRPAGRVEADADGPRRLDRVLEPRRRSGRGRDGPSSWCSPRAPARRGRAAPRRTCPPAHTAPRSDRASSASRRAARPGPPAPPGSGVW